MGFRIRGLGEMPREIPTGRKKEEDRGLITKPTLPFIGREEKEEPQKETQELPVSYGGGGGCAGGNNQNPEQEDICKIDCDKLKTHTLKEA